MLRLYRRLYCLQCSVRRQDSARSKYLYIYSAIAPRALRKIWHHAYLITQPAIFDQKPSVFYHFSYFKYAYAPRRAVGRGKRSQITKLMGPTWGPPGPVGPRWAPCWPHEPCYQRCRHDYVMIVDKGHMHCFVNGKSAACGRMSVWKMKLYTCLSYSHVAYFVTICYIIKLMTCV